MAHHEIEVGKSGSLSSIRKHLQKEHNMLQIWAGKTGGEDTDYIIFVGGGTEEFVVVTSLAGSSVYTITEHGQIIFMHSKNLRKLARSSDGFY